MRETVNVEATNYYHARFAHHLEQGLDKATAEERADFDLLEWSQPLPLPDFELDYSDEGLLAAMEMPEDIMF